MWGSTEKGRSHEPQLSYRTCFRALTSPGHTEYAQTCSGYVAIPHTRRYMDAAPHQKQFALQLPWHSREDSTSPARRCSLIRRMNCAHAVYCEHAML
jgi:hypothetical protein